jgi:hypothetical protein
MRQYEACIVEVAAGGECVISRQPKVAAHRRQLAAQQEEEQQGARGVEIKEEVDLEEPAVSVTCTVDGARNAHIPCSFTLGDVVQVLCTSEGRCFYCAVKLQALVPTPLLSFLLPLLPTTSPKFQVQIQVQVVFYIRIWTQQRVVPLAHCSNVLGHKPFFAINNFLVVQNRKLSNSI